VKDKIDIFHASQNAYAFWDQFMEDMKSSGWRDVWQLPMEPVTNNIESQVWGAADLMVACNHQPYKTLLHVSLQGSSVYRASTGLWYRMSQ
jgi:hypothetical protein